MAIEPLISHKRCCVTALDKARHEVARAEDSMLRQERAGKEGSSHYESCRRHAEKYRRKLMDLELEALKKWERR